MKDTNKKYNYNRFNQKSLNKIKNRRVKRAKGVLFGSDLCPRLCVNKSNKNIYVQIIDDNKMNTLISFQGELKKSFEIGEKIAKDALSKKISKVVFDRRGNKYHGNIKKLAEGARKGGLKF